MELPSFLSNRSAVEVHMKVDTNSLSTHKNGSEIKVDLPLHARYQVSKKEIMEWKTNIGTACGIETTITC